jgi:HEAT repeat protein
MTIEQGDNPGPANNFTFDDLRAAAKEENWELVDSHIPNFCDDNDTFNWARKSGIKSEDGNERDLAVSLLEKTGRDLEEEDSSGLLQMIDTDQNPYVRFRSAFALFAHGNRSEKVISKIKEAAQDEDVKEIAEGYLSQLK